MNNIGEMTVLLGTYFKVPGDLDKWPYGTDSDFHKILKLRIYTERGEYDL